MLQLSIRLYISDYTFPIVIVSHLDYNGVEVLEYGTCILEEICSRIFPYYCITNDNIINYYGNLQCIAHQIHKQINRETTLSGHFVTL